MTDLRIGHGFDLHRLTENRKLILGGIEIPYTLGLLGHSDADVLVHAIMDAMLGALSLGDIGLHFPPEDEKYKDISSIKLLHHVKNLINEKGYKIVNTDSTILAQKPKLLPYIQEIRQSLAKELEINIENISVKATTTEKLGDIGKGLAIATESVVLLEKI
ncbi:MAG: 2-C-methyl-D-erythritol 2,4-cyclodiphosphate synthase [Candidatus Gastranaerophilales bacterium]|nr:2-C-methyl-D-erythritol 2,4-cyclodiphosphate synthase [Candidatus Gastranaerophilales bacterium]